jgi:myo-inositol-1(or 4)-monophosphatase
MMLMKSFVESLTKKAGKELLLHFNKDPALIQVRGSVKDVVTKYDETVDELIVKAIKKEYPGHNLMTEESGFIDNGSDYLWIVDSLDGTVNFACGNPLFGVCIALMKKGELQLGAIYCPAIDEFYFAEKGKGAYLNGKKIHVSPAEELGKSYVFQCEGGSKDRVKTAALLDRIYPNVMDLRKLGSAGVEAAWVALGRGDAYVTTSIEPWDVAPGVLLVQEAGGMVTDFEGNDWQLKKSNLIFSNSKLHGQLLGLTKGF